MSTAKRTPEQIRAEIESNRKELGLAVVGLRDSVLEVTDWRKQLREHQRQFVVGAAVAGFVVGGGIAGVVGLFRRRR